MDINLLVKISARAWALKILALLHNGTPGRQALLLRACGAGRTAFTQSLEHLIDLGLVERNPGHGHPLRPEYRLTVKGAEMSNIAANIINLTPNEDEFTLLRRAWTLPILAATQQPRRFSEIRHKLSSITDRALSKSLDQLHEQDWVRRSVNPTARPLHPIYLAVNKGSDIGQTLSSRTGTP